MSRRHGPAGAERLAVLWFRTAVAISALLVLAIPFHWLFPEFLPHVLRAVQLTRENNVGAWWSGILLFMLGMHAYDAGVAERERAPSVARAWVILAAILVFLSADEIGSMHERLGAVGDLLGLGSWALVLPLGAVLGVGMLYALWTLWQDGASRRHVVPLFVGFAVLGSVAGQEVIEHAVDWSGDTVWIRAMIEEGTELLGMLLLLRVLLRPTLDILARPVPADRHVFTVLHDRPRILFLGLLLLIPVFTWLSTLFADGRGRLPDWLGAVTFLAAGLAALSLIVRTGSDRPGRLVAIAALGVLASICAVAVHRAAAFAIGDIEIGRRALVLGVISLMIAGLWFGATRASSRRLLPFLAAIGLVLALGPVVGAGSLQSAILTQVLAVLILALTWLATAAERPPVTAVAPQAG